MKLTKTQEREYRRVMSIVAVEVDPKVWTHEHHRSSKQIDIDTRDMEVLAAVRMAYYKNGWNCYAMVHGHRRYLEFFTWYKGTPS